MFKTRNSYQEKPEMAIEKRKKTSYNGTKETNKKRWSKWHERKNKIILLLDVLN